MSCFKMNKDDICIKHDENEKINHISIISEFIIYQLW